MMTGWVICQILVVLEDKKNVCLIQKLLMMLVGEQMAHFMQSKISTT